MNKEWKPNLQAECWGRKIKTLHYPQKPPLTEAEKSHPEKAEAITQRALNEKMLSMRKKGKMRRKIILFRTPSTEPHQYLSSSLPLGRIGDMRRKKRKKGAPHRK